MNWYLEMLKQYVISGGQVPSREFGSIILLGFVAQDNQSNENQGGCNPKDAAA